MSRAKFQVFGRLDLAARITTGTVTIDRGHRTFSVRPARRRRTDDLPLDVVADMVVLRVVRTEKFLKLAAKAKERAAKKGGRR